MTSRLLTPLRHARAARLKNSLLTRNRINPVSKRSQESLRKPRRVLISAASRVRRSSSRGSNNNSSNSNSNSNNNSSNSNSNSNSNNSNSSSQGSKTRNSLPNRSMNSSK